MEPVGHILARMMYLSMETKTRGEREKHPLKHCDELMLTELLQSGDKVEVSADGIG